MNIIVNYVLKHLLANIPQLLTTTFSISAVWFILTKATKVLKEIGELVNAIVVALADKKLTKDEVSQIIKEAKDIPVAVKELLHKK